jgi:cellulose synthase operon protein C
MASCDHLQRTSMYFDGELAPADEREAADHLATCAECQAVLGDAVGLDAVLSRAKAVPAASVAPRRRWPIAVGAATLVAVAAIAIVVLRLKPHDKPREHVALVLPAKRSLEARFSGDAFTRHRPYEPPRDRAHEAIDVRALADLEPHDLVGALASTGELTRAAEVARKSPIDPRALSDLAAISLGSGDAEAALDFAYRALAIDPQLPAARWNLGLAARQLQLWRVSRAAFEQVAARAEPGWAAEAKQHVEHIDRELARTADVVKLHAQFELLVTAGSVRNVVTDPALHTDIVEFQRISRSILEDQTPIDLALVRRYPSHALAFLYESLRKATPAIVDGLEPVAAALDEVSSTTVATGLTKRSLVARARLPDPLAADDTAVAIPQRCANDLFAIPCVPLAWRIARDALAAGKLAEAEEAAARGRDLALAEQLSVDYALLAEIHRKQQRTALARAELEETRP